MPATLGERIATGVKMPDFCIACANGTFISSRHGVPGRVFVTPVRRDTLNRKTYVWDGTRYVQIGAY